MTAQIGWLPDGRMHLHHGPIDLVITAIGPGRDEAYSRAKRRFPEVLEELVLDLPALRSPPGQHNFQRPIANRMARAVHPFLPAFITPMAAVAGAVADDMRDAMMGPGVHKLLINNGGDIAIHLAPGHQMTAAIAGGLPARMTLTAYDGIRGIATSGWRGRSHSLGIADSVTVLARTAAAADAAATMIANAVDLPGHPSITRSPAQDLFPDSDLGHRPVTIAVGHLSSSDVKDALDQGWAMAQRCVTDGIIHGAALALKGSSCVTGQTVLKEYTDA